MPELISLTKSDRPGKKWKVIVADKEHKKTIHFGQRGADDFTLTGDKEQKARYIDRHKDKEDWTDVFSAGFWSRWLLWNKPTISASLADIKRTFNL